MANRPRRDEPCLISLLLHVVQCSAGHVFSLQLDLVWKGAIGIGEHISQGTATIVSIKPRDFSSTGIIFYSVCYVVSCSLLGTEVEQVSPFFCTRPVSDLSFGRNTVPYC